MKIHGANSEYCLSYSLCPLSFTSMWTSDKGASHFVFTQSFIYSFFAALSSLPDNLHYVAEPSSQPFSLFPLHFNYNAILTNLNPLAFYMAKQVSLY